MTRLLIASAVRVFRDGLVDRLPQYGPIRVVGTASTWSELAEAACELKPAVVLVGIDMAPNLPSAIKISAGSPEMKFIGTCANKPGPDWLRWIEAGADYCIPASATCQCIAAAVLGVASGKILWPDQFAGLLAARVRELSRALAQSRQDALCGLTERELEVAALASAGASNKEIGRRLGIRVPTAKNHLRNIGRKLNVSGRAGIMAWYLNHVSDSHVPAIAAADPSEGLRGLHDSDMGAGVLGSQS